MFTLNPLPIALSTHQSDFIVITAVSTDIVLRSISYIKSAFSSGCDLVLGFLRRDCAAVIAYPPAFMYNLSLKSSVYPDVWEQVHPVFELGNHYFISNYHPIAIKSPIAKYFEICIHHCVSCMISNYISPEQHDFLK